MSDTTEWTPPLVQDRSDTAAGLLALAVTASLLSACGGGGSGGGGLSLIHI